MATTQDLAVLLETPTDDQIQALLLATLQAADFPVTDWYTGGVERTALAAVRTGIKSFATDFIPVIAASGFLGLADDDWITVVADEVYDLLRNGASNTIGNLVMTAGTGVGPYTVGAGALWVLFPSGNRYNNPSAFTIPLSGSVTVPVRSEYPNDSTANPPLNYTDASGLTLTVVTPALPGVTATNPAPTYSAVTQIGRGPGTVTPTGTPSGSHQIAIRIDSTGQAGVMSWSYSIDGAAYVSGGVAASFTNLGGIAGLNGTFTNGSFAPSFVAEETYTYATPGSWITTQGTDQEKRGALETRCRARWPDLGVAPTELGYNLWARQASAQVTQVYVAVDGTVNNKVLVYIAGQAGVVSGDVVKTVQDYCDARKPQTDAPVVGSPVPRAVTLSAATVRCASSLLAAAQAKAQALVNAYINSGVFEDETNGTINGRVQLVDLTTLVRDIDGVENITGLSITGANDGVDLQLPVTGGAIEILSWSQDVTTLWTWIPT